jgi:signal transduction histidine kinase
MDEALQPGDLLPELSVNAPPVDWQPGDENLARELTGIALLDGLDEDALSWLASNGEAGSLSPGQRGFSDGEPAEYLMLLLDGQVQFQIETDGVIVYAGTMEAGEAGGFLPYSRMTHHTGSAVALAPSRVFRIHCDKFPEMGMRIPELVRRLVGLMSDRVRESTRIQQQREKMMALGKLSAGLAHELNNPAAAIRSATGELLKRLTLMPGRVMRLGRHDLKEEQLLSISSLPELLASSDTQGLKALERSRREDEIADWLDERGVPDGWRLAETFVEAGFALQHMEQIADNTPAEALPDVLCWVEGHTAVFNLVREVAAAADRVSSLVGSVKSYSHMDRAVNKELIDVHEGIDTTLTMMGHKLRKQSITVEKLYGDDLPRVAAFAGELNQVWTNLIDNAIDAMPESGGVLRIETSCSNQTLRVAITDNGSGIPNDVQGRIFEPFFTTKSVGEGTGLGLDIAHRIVTRQHQGFIDVESRPGCTRFVVSLPVAPNGTGR